jgi:hypothetical protein
MKTTLWLSGEEIELLTNALSSHHNSIEVAVNILKELGVAKARANSNRLLSSSFKSILGKESNQFPIKLSDIEFSYLSDNKLIKPETRE